MVFHMKMRIIIVVMSCCFWILGERTHIKSFNCACLASGKILNKSWLLISVYNLRQVTLLGALIFSYRKWSYIIPNSESLWRSNGISYLKCLVDVAHRSCFIQHGVPNPMSCFVFVQWICIEQITCYMLGYRGQRDQVPALKSLHFTGGEGEREAAEIRYDDFGDCDQSNEGYGSGSLGVGSGEPLGGWVGSGVSRKMWKVRGVSCLNSKGMNTWWGT